MRCCPRATDAATDRRRSRLWRPGPIRGGPNAAPALSAGPSVPGGRSGGRGAGVGQRPEGRLGGCPGAAGAGVHGPRLVSFPGVHEMRRNIPQRATLTLAAQARRYMTPSTIRDRIQLIQPSSPSVRRHVADFRSPRASR